MDAIYVLKTHQKYWISLKIHVANSIGKKSRVIHPKLRQSVTLKTGEGARMEDGSWQDTVVPSVTFSLIQEWADA